MKYEFQGLLEKDKKGSITGPMSPILFMNGVSKELGFKWNRLCRVINPHSNSGYDHLIAKAKMKTIVAYFLIVDMGSNGIPIAMVQGDNSFFMTDIYKKETTTEKMKYHRENCEIYYKEDTPIMILDEKEIRSIFKQAEKSGAFQIKGTNLS